MEEVLDYAIKIANEAGTLVIKYYEQGFAVRHKRGDDPVTEADTAAEELIVKRLREKFDYPILAEENVRDEKRFDSEYVWTVDPIDGTREFVKKTGKFCVMIGLLENGKPVLGVIHRPVEKDTFYAVKGKGTFRLKEDKKKKLRVSSTDTVLKERIVFNTHSQKIADDAGKLFTGEDADIFGPWSIGYGICELVSGNLDVWIYAGNFGSEWDACPVQIILEEAGGKTTGRKGEQITYNRNNPVITCGFVCTNNVLHEHVLERLSGISIPEE